MLFKSKSLILVLTVLMMAAVVGCSSPGGTEPDPQPNGQDSPTIENHLPGEVSGPEVLEGPETITGIISLEGMDEEFTFVRLHGEDLGFVTYIPEGMEAEFSSSNEGNGVIIYANKDAEAYLSIFLYQEGTTLEDAAETVKNELIAAGYEPFESDPDYSWQSWSLDEFTFAKSDLVNNTAFGNVGERILQVTLHMPLEFGDGLGPRAEIILEGMQWYSM